MRQSADKEDKAKDLANLTSIPFPIPIPKTQKVRIEMEQE
jgi:hypothetical protein